MYTEKNSRSKKGLAFSAPFFSGLVSWELDMRKVCVAACFMYNVDVHVHVRSMAMNIILYHT